MAHDEAANPSALLDAAVTVGADGAVREITVSWGSWRYTVTFSNLGTTRSSYSAGEPATAQRALVLDFVLGLLRELDDVALPEEDLS